LLAAEKGFTSAQHGLGCMLANGAADELTEAVKWIEIANLTSDGDDRDISCIEKATQNMSKDQVERAKNMAREFIKKNKTTVSRCKFEAKSRSEPAQHDSSSFVTAPLSHQ
jgi:hypothetical protein